MYRLDYEHPNDSRLSTCKDRNTQIEIIELAKKILKEDNPNLDMLDNLHDMSQSLHNDRKWISATYGTFRIEIS